MLIWIVEECRKYMIVEGISKKIATYLYENTNNKDKFTYNKLYYGLQIIVNFVIVTIALLILSVAFGVFTKALYLFIATLLLRQFSGGIHLKTSESCAVASVLILLIIVLLPRFEWIIWIDVISVVMIGLFAPATFKVSKERRPKPYYMMKSISVLIILLNMFVIKDFYISLIFLIQSISVVWEHYRLKNKI
jgi:accessory gene regulator B